MHFLLLNQTFHPDVMATSQYLTELAEALAARGHGVTVVTSRRAYDDPNRKFPARETWHGVQIFRVGSTGFGKRAKWRRAADFASFITACCLRLARLPRPDAVVALTSPPLISFIGAWAARIWRARFFYWVMDLNPDEAIAAGWLRVDSLAGRMLERMSRFSLRRAQRVIALDRFMRDRIVAKSVPAEKVLVLSPWSHDDKLRFDAAGRERFRKAHGLADRFVVMYSGNHSPCHPLDTLLAAARELADDARFQFVFIGGGSEFKKVQGLMEQRNSAQPQPRIPNPKPSPNLLCLPYQPLTDLSASLSAADLHVVVMGEPFVGTIHPCKIYNVLNVGAPVLCIGPRPSHLTEILETLGSSECATVTHGDPAGCRAAIERIAALNRRGEPSRYEAVARQFSQGALLPRLIAELESDHS